MINFSLLILSLACFLLFLWADHEAMKTRDNKTKEIVNVFKVVLACIGSLSMFIALLLSI